MSNKGKFIDRNPNMCAAGRHIVVSEPIGDIIKDHPEEELAESIVKFKCKKAQEAERRQGPIRFSTFVPEDSLGELMSPELKKTRFVTFREKFLETMYFPKPQVGQILPSGSKPDHLTNDNTTYGCKSTKSDNLYETILPKKTPREVNRDYYKWHDKYIVSHNHYFPSERINRHYVGKFDPNATFGVIQNVDKTGKTMKKVMKDCDALAVIGKEHKKFLNRTQGRLGERINRYELNVDPNIALGKVVPKDECSVQSLIENRSKCEEDSHILPALAHVNKLRRYLLNKLDFHMYDLRALLQRYDRNSTGYVTFQDIFKALRSLLIYYNENKIRLAAIHFGFVVDKDLPTERVNLDKFYKMLHIQHLLPHIKKTNDNEDADYKYNNETTYRLLCKDRDKPLPPAGYLQRLHKPTDNERTRVYDLISPSIPLHYGLGPSDFEVERPKEELKRIFQRILTDEFDAVWEMARDKVNGDEDCKISVIALREAMNIYRNNKISQSKRPSFP